MDALTAGTALIMAQLCVALVMAGIYRTAPAENCTRLWALSGFSMAIGLLIVILNAGAPRYAVLVIGNNLLILGLALQWAGIRAFYRKKQGIAGWTVFIAFFILFGLLLLNDARVGDRALLSSATILVMLLLFGFEVLTGDGPRRSFARRLTIAALMLMIASYSFRVVATILNTAELLPDSNTSLSVIFIYLTPIAGTLLLSNGLVLLYFERIVADKHHLATHDELTRLLNRRAIVLGGEREVRLASRLHTPLTIALADIDHFKQINDTLGHDAGDSVLVEAAQILKKTCRNVDLIGRYGGEEFCIVFPGVGEDGAGVLGERLVNAIATHSFAVGKPITLSVGLASLGAGSQTLAGLIESADKELYKAKQAGRNRYFVSMADKAMS